MPKMFLPTGASFQFDVEDFQKISAFKWNRSFGYMKRNSIHRVLLHTFLTGYRLTDHIDGDRSNNRRSNLRESSRSQNAANRVKLMRNNTSGFAGVSFNKRKGKWTANIRVNKKQIYLGLFAEKEAASEIYKKAHKEHFKDFSPY